MEELRSCGDRRRAHPEMRAATLPFAMSWAGDVAHRVDRDREADADVALMPSLPVWICEVTPITRPSASISGPPELPWLIAASVWIALSIGSAVRREDLRAAPR